MAGLRGAIEAGRLGEFVARFGAERTQSEPAV
jgi:hypothetical protein